MFSTLRIPVLIAALALAPVLRADPAPAVAPESSTAQAQPTPAATPAVTPIPTPVPTPVAAAPTSSGINWATVGWGALIVAVLVGVVVLIANSSKGGSSGGSGSSGGYRY